MEICCNAHTVGQLPPGFELKFNPTPEILVRNYLLPKLMGKSLPCKAAVKECDLYGDLHPEQIWDKLGGPELCKGEDLFFFTPLKKNNMNNIKFIRTNGVGGTWTSKQGKEVCPRNDCGWWRRLTYKHSVMEHCGWTVFEYTMAKDSCSPQALCQLRKQEQNHHETTTTGKRIRHDSVNQDSHTDAGDPSDSIFNRLPPINENWEVPNFNTSGGVPPSLNYTEPSLEHYKEWDFLRGLTLDELTAISDQLKINQDSITDDVVPPSQNLY